MNKKNSRRFERERKTINAMIKIYCRKLHKTKVLCKTCNELSEYALKRLDYCPFITFKPTCLKCPVHCYNSEMRERVREVMRFSGPRMPLRHPYLTIMHYIDSSNSHKAKK